MGEPTAIQQNQQIDFSADTLAAAQRKLGDQWPGNQFGFAARGDDAKSMLLLVAPRNIDMVKLNSLDLEFTDIEPATSDRLAPELDEVLQGQNVGKLYVQAGLPTDSSTMYFADDVAQAGSHNLKCLYGAHLLLLEAHTGDLGAAWGGMAIDYMITMAPDLPAAEANAFTTALWAQIADEQDVEEAYERAISACSEQARHQIEKHW
jgi:hypothetical protein